MDFYFDIGLAVILRIVKDRRSAAKYFSGLAKLYLALRQLSELDLAFKNEIMRKEQKP